MIRSELYVTKRMALAPRGMVTAEHPLGAEVGATILARGGNAVDAAVATAFAMTVVEPFMSTIGGSGTMLVHLRKRGETLALDFNGMAPLRAHDGMFRVTGGVSDAMFAWPRVENEANVFGHLSAAVPGSVAGLALALERWGTMELGDVLEPAIRLASEGFVLDWYQVLNHARAQEELSAFPETSRVYFRKQRFVHRPPSANPGDRVTYPDLARSLGLIAKEGPDAFYRGAIAQAIEDDMARNGGLIGKADLAAYQVRVAPPLAGRYRGVDLAFSPGATGGITALEILNVLGQFPAARVGWRTVDGLDLRARVVRRAFADRFAHLGDPEQVKVDWDRFASTAYGREIAAELRDARGARRASPARSERRGLGGHFGAPILIGGLGGHFGAPMLMDGLGGHYGRVRAPLGAAMSADECTTHVCAVDRDRNMVSLTHTAVSLWGSRVVVPGTGILLNNGMLWFDPEPGKPNSVAPGKRGMVNMVPALGFKRGQPYFTVGAPGGRKIVSAIPQVIANLVDGARSLQDAIEAPRLHAEGDALEIDDRVGEKTLEKLGRRGHTVIPKADTYSTVSFSRPIGVRVVRRGLEAGLEHLGAAAAAGH